MGSGGENQNGHARRSGLRPINAGSSDGPISRGVSSSVYFTRDGSPPASNPRCEQEVDLTRGGGTGRRIRTAMVEKQIRVVSVIRSAVPKEKNGVSMMRLRQSAETITERRCLANTISESREAQIDHRICDLRCDDVVGEQQGLRERTCDENSG